jgi:uncharacterized phage-like protein YoqJ
VQEGKPLIVCLTGHRRIPPRHAILLPALLEKEMLALIEGGAVEFRAGGAIGYDMVATLKILELKEKFPNIKLRLCLPCQDQAKGWDEVGRRAYNYILAHADEISYTSQAYTPTCMLERDRQLVNGSDVCLAYCTENRGGTFYTCTYALKRGLELINLADQLPKLK